MSLAVSGLWQFQGLGSFSALAVSTAVSEK
jgi:hypothetical protein